jgi:N-terminal domain of galactosyltransferase
MTPEGKKVAVTAGCMDRPGPLERVIRSWVALPEADHVVVVDWSSQEPLRRLTQVETKVLVVRVSGQQFWRNSMCHNLEVTVASELGCDLVLRTDADVVVRLDFIPRHPVDESSFYAVDCHQVPAECDDKRNLCGTLFAHVSHLLTVNGYNERLLQYGYEDEDLYDRLERAGLTWRRCDVRFLDHIPHSDASRIARLDLRDAPPDVARASTRRVVDHYVYKSQDLARSRPWRAFDRRTRWTITRVTTNYWEAQPH